MMPRELAWIACQLLRPPLLCLLCLLMKRCNLLSGVLDLNVGSLTTSWDLIMLVHVPALLATPWLASCSPVLPPCRKAVLSFPLSAFVIYQCRFLASCVGNLSIWCPFWSRLATWYGLCSQPLTETCTRTLQYSGGARWAVSCSPLHDPKWDHWALSLHTTASPQQKRPTILAGRPDAASQSSDPNRCWAVVWTLSGRPLSCSMTAGENYFLLGSKTLGILGALFLAYCSVSPNAAGWRPLSLNSEGECGDGAVSFVSEPGPAYNVCMA